MATLDLTIMRRELRSGGREATRRRVFTHLMRWCALAVLITFPAQAVTSALYRHPLAWWQMLLYAYVCAVWLAVLVRQRRRFALLEQDRFWRRLMNEALERAEAARLIEDVDAYNTAAREYNIALDRWTREYGAPFNRLVSTSYVEDMLRKARK